MEQQPIVLKEICSHGTKSLPCAVYRTHSVGKGVFVKHHWHDEIEILYFSEGGFRLEINMESFEIQSECIYFINPGELHGIISETLERHWGETALPALYHAAASRLFIVAPLLSAYHACVRTDGGSSAGKRQR